MFNILDGEKMSDDGIVIGAVRLISCLTRENVEWGTRSLMIWKKRKDLNILECINLAREELYGDSIKDNTIEEPNEL